MNMMNTYFPSTPSKSQDNEPSILDAITEIEPLFDYPPETSEGFEYYLKSLKKLVCRVLPQEVLDYGLQIFSLRDREKIALFYKKIESLFSADIRFPEK